MNGTQMSSGSPQTHGLRIKRSARPEPVAPRVATLWTVHPVEDDHEVGFGIVAFEIHALQRRVRVVLPELNRLSKSSVPQVVARLGRSAREQRASPELTTPKLYRAPVHRGSMAQLMDSLKLVRQPSECCFPCIALPPRSERGRLADLPLGCLGPNTKDHVRNGRRPRARSRRCASSERPHCPVRPGRYCSGRFARRCGPRGRAFIRVSILVHSARANR
jgi:hypothetical protein